MNKTVIDPSLLDKAPLTPYEKDLIKQIDIEGLPLKDVAVELKKDDSTISLQHKRALEKYSEWCATIAEEHKHDIAVGTEAALVFELLEKGTGLADVVIETKIDPERVKMIYEAWVEMKEVDLNSPSVPKKLKQIEEKLENVTGLIVKELTRHGYEGLPDEYDLRQFLNSAPELLKLKDLRCFTDSMYERYECAQCGSKYYYAIHVQCTKCGRDSTWGYHPK